MQIEQKGRLWSNRKAETAERTLVVKQRFRKNKKDAGSQTEMQIEQKGCLRSNKDAKRTERTLVVKQRCRNISKSRRKFFNEVFF